MLENSYGGPQMYDQMPIDGAMNAKKKTTSWNQISELWAFGGSFGETPRGCI